MNSQQRSQETRKKHIKKDRKYQEKLSKIVQKRRKAETENEEWLKSVEKKRNSHVWIGVKLKLISIGKYDQFNAPKSTLNLHRSKFIRFGTNHHLMQVVHISLNHRMHSSCVCHSSAYTQSENYHRRHQPELKSRLILSNRHHKQPTTMHSTQ